MHYTPKYLAFQDSVQRFVDEEFNPHAEVWEAASTFPTRGLISLAGGADEILLQIICKYTGILLKR